MSRMPYRRKLLAVVVVCLPVLLLQCRSLLFHSTSNQQLSAATDQRSSLIGSLYVEHDNSNFTKTVAAARAAAPTTIRWDNDTVALTEIKSYWLSGRKKKMQRLRMCRVIDKLRKRNKTTNILVDYKFSCLAIFRNSTAGSANWLIFFYELRLSAASMHVDFILSCMDANTQKTALLTPWSMGFFPAKAAAPITSDYDACHNARTTDGRKARPLAQYDLRRMAIALLGIPDSRHPAAAWARQHLYNSSAASNSPVVQVPNPGPHDKPLVNVELDEAVIHFRCGDLMNSSHTRYGFIRFSDYARHIPQHTKSIGILTQPYAPGAQVRERDRIGRDRCPIVVAAFLNYLQARFPDARVAVRNDISETVPVAVSRMVLAATVVVGRSSMGGFGAAASFGQAYAFRDRLEEESSNVVAFNATLLTCTEVQAFWERDATGQALIAWLQSDM